MTQAEYDVLKPGDLLVRKGVRGRPRKVVKPGPQKCHLEPLPSKGKRGKNVKKEGVAIYSVWEIRQFFQHCELRVVDEAPVLAPPPPVEEAKPVKVEAVKEGPKCGRCGGSGPFREGRKQCKSCETQLAKERKAAKK